jgi:hypothetical protein
VALAVSLSAFSVVESLAQPPALSKNLKSYRAQSGQMVALPKLLTSEFHTIEQVSEDALKQGKELALIAVKSHGCDCGMQCHYCLEETRNISDPANTFVQKNFALYHFRIMATDSIEKFEKQELKFNEMKATKSAGVVTPHWLPQILEVNHDRPSPKNR